MSPADRYCGHCRNHLITHPANSRPTTMKPARLWRRWGAFLFDSLAWLMLLSCFLSPPVWVVLLSLPFLAALVEVRDGRTPGQQIFALKRLRPDGNPLTSGAWLACLRSAWWPWGRRSTQIFWVPD